MKKIILTLLFAFSVMFAFEELNLKNFDAKVANKNVLLDFHATW